MVIGYDAKRAYYNSSGLGNYSRSLITAIHQYFPAEKLALFTPGKGNAAYNDFMRGNDNVEIISPKGLNKVLPSLWRTAGMKNDIINSGVQVFHGLSNELPSGIPGKKVKAVVTIHDLIFKRHPQYYKAVDRNIYDHKFKKSCEAADRIIAISEQTKRDIVSFYKTAPEKIEVIYQAAGNYLRTDIGTDEREQVRKKYNLPAEYILSVGTIEERKNLVLVIRAMAVLKDKLSVPLVIVGRATAYKQELLSLVGKNKLEGKVFFLEGINTLELQSLYSGAKLFVYPSRFEGFGIPVIEALHYGVPVIAATGSSLEEAGGPSSVYVNADDAEAMANAIENILTHSSLATDMREKGRRYAERFSARRFAEETMKCYRSVLGSS